MNRRQVALFVKRKRKEKKMSQTDLAIKSGFSQGKLSKVENGILDLSVPEFYKVANSLGCVIMIMEVA